MMKKLISILTALMMTAGCAAAEGMNGMMMGGEDVPEKMEMQEIAPAKGSLTLAFDANITTGYSWSAFVLGGDSVVINESGSGYVSDPNPDKMDGVGGTHYFVLDAVHSGETLIRFTLGRGWESEVIEERLMLISVDDDLVLQATDVTKSGVMDGIVLSVDKDAHTVNLLSDMAGEVIVTIPEDQELPMEQEVIRVYSNGVMTLSLPAMVNAIAWETQPDERGRMMMEETDEDLIAAVIQETAQTLQELANDKTYIALMTGGDASISDVISRYAATRGAQAVSCRELQDEDSLYRVLADGVDLDRLSDAGAYMLEQRIYTAGTVASVIAARDGSAALAATSILNLSGMMDLAMESNLFLQEYADGTGIIVGIWNDGSDATLVTAAFIPRVSVLAEDKALAALFE